MADCGMVCGKGRFIFCSKMDFCHALELCKELIPNNNFSSGLLTINIEDQKAFDFMAEILPCYKVKCITEYRVNGHWRRGTLI